MFILEYEKGLVNYFQKSPLNLSSVFFGTDDYRFADGFSKVKQFPYLYLVRDFSHKEEMIRRKYIHDGNERYDFVTLPVTYRAICVWDKVVDVFSAMMELRFYLMNNPNLYIMDKDVCDGEILRVPLRYLNFDYKEVNNALDEKGTVRYCGFEWRSDLYFVNKVELPTYKEIKIIVRPNGEQGFCLYESTEI